MSVKEELAAENFKGSPSTVYNSIMSSIYIVYGLVFIVSDNLLNIQVLKTQESLDQRNEVARSGGQSQTFHTT